MTDYGGMFTSAVNSGNIFGVQFHPEKSHNGVFNFYKILRNYKMLQPRIIPCLLVKNMGLVKTVNFKNEKYVGDPINAVRIFNEKEVDELIVLDIDATTTRREPDFRMIENLASECRMPFCYGGGVKTAEQALRIIGLGVEKIALSSAAVDSPELVSEIAEQVGSQSVVVVMDVKKNVMNGNYEIWTHNGRRCIRKCPIEFAQQLERFGVGEVIVNSIDNDGMMKGYDFTLVDKIRKSITVPDDNTRRRGVA